MVLGGIEFPRPVESFLDFFQCHVNSFVKSGEVRLEGSGDVCRKPRIWRTKTHRVFVRTDPAIFCAVYIRSFMFLSFVRLSSLRNLASVLPSFPEDPHSASSAAFPFGSFGNAGGLS